MANNDFDRLFGRLNELAVGFGPIFKDFQQTTTHYPPHNIVTISDTEFLLELAVAGFKKSEITIQEKRGELIITADKKDSTPSDAIYQYRGIAKRSFSKRFQVAEFFEVCTAHLEDGILTIKFEKWMPEEEQNNFISIT